MGDNASDSYQVPEIVKNRQLAVVSGLTFAVLVGALGTALYFAKYAGSGYNMNSPAAQMAANRRLQKVGDVSLQITDAGGGAPKTGEEAYKAVCAACHGTGAAGAPKFGDAAEWGPRIAQGESVLLKHALEGFKGSKGVMPPKGGSSLSDDEVHRAMVYMPMQAAPSSQNPRQVPQPVQPAVPLPLQVAHLQPLLLPLPVPQAPPLPRPAMQARHCSSRPARPATAPVWPVRPSLATRPPGLPASLRARTRSSSTPSVASRARVASCRPRGAPPPPTTT